MSHGQPGIWVRLFTRGAGGIRLGLPPDEAGWSRLQEALNMEPTWLSFPSTP
jgi:cobalamin biosynthetic protein CobC